MNESFFDPDPLIIFMGYELLDFDSVFRCTCMNISKRICPYRVKQGINKARAAL